MRKSIVILLHVGYWTLYWFLFTFLFILSNATDQSAFEDWDDWIAILTVASVTGLIGFYSFYSWLVPRYLNTRNVQKFIGLGLVVSVAIAGLTTVLISVASTVIISMALHTTTLVIPALVDQLALLGAFTLLALVNGIVGTIIRGFITWYTDIHVKETLANKTLRTELALLKAQINPHFLFNTLNNIDILIERDAPGASLYLNKLSDLLRFVLYETQADLIPLTQELEYIKKYIDLQKIRTANDQFVTLQIDGPADGLMIAPMLFVPYLENAFKYATNKKVNEAIRIHITIDETQIRFQCVNVIDKGKTVSDSQGGLGNELIRQRLALLYKENHTLEILATDDAYSVNLLVPVKAHELSPH